MFTSNNGNEIGKSDNMDNACLLCNLNQVSKVVMTSPIDLHRDVHKELTHKKAAKRNYQVTNFSKECFLSFAEHQDSAIFALE